MKIVLIMLSLLLATNVSQAKLTESFCKSLTNEQLGEFFVEFLALGAHDGRPLLKSCNLIKKWSRVNTQERDVYPKYILINSTDRVLVDGSIKIADELLNLLEVNYIIEKEGKTLKGKFTFLRVYNQQDIDDLGCAFIVDQPDTPFIKKECKY